MSFLMGLICMGCAAGLTLILQKVLNPKARLPYSYMIRGAVLIMITSSLAAAVHNFLGAPTEVYHLISQAAFFVFIWYVIWFHELGHAAKNDWAVWSHK